MYVKFICVRFGNRWKSQPLAYFTASTNNFIITDNVCILFIYHAMSKSRKCQLLLKRAETSIVLIVWWCIYSNPQAPPPRSQWCYNKCYDSRLQYTIYLFVSKESIRLWFLHC